MLVRPPYEGYPVAPPTGRLCSFCLSAIGQISPFLYDFMVSFESKGIPQEVLP